uniref:Band 7 domain-containing protein n=1 Tax=Setaria digitata TaxID=48799 RepID=A0A915Q362_9BILA
MSQLRQKLVVQEYERVVIFRLGRLMPGGAKGPGIFFIVPCIDTYRKVDLRVISFEVPPQEILSKDSVTVAVDAVVYFRISNATVSVTNVEDAARSTKLLAQTTLRNILGTKTLTEMLSDREAISLQMQITLDEATEPWGVKVERVEVKDVRLPIQLQRAMAAEAEAAREARAKVIVAEGEQKASHALKEAAEVIAESPSALQLRYLQTLNSISAEKNSTIIFPFPIDLLSSFFHRSTPKVVETPVASRRIRPCCLYKYPEWVQQMVDKHPGKENQRNISRKPNSTPNISLTSGYHRLGARKMASEISLVLKEATAKTETQSKPDETSINAITTAIPITYNITKNSRRQIRHEMNELARNKHRNDLLSSLLKQSIINRMQIKNDPNKNSLHQEDVIGKNVSILNIIRSYCPDKIDHSSEITDQNVQRSMKTMTDGDERGMIQTFTGMRKSTAKSVNARNFDNVTSDSFQTSNNITMPAVSASLTTSIRDNFSNFSSKNPSVDFIRICENDATNSGTINSTAAHCRKEKADSSSSENHIAERNSSLSKATNKYCNRSVTFADHVIVVEIEGRIRNTNSDQKQHESESSDEGSENVKSTGITQRRRQLRSKGRICSKDNEHFEKQKADVSDRWHEESLYEISQSSSSLTSTLSSDEDLTLNPMLSFTNHLNNSVGRDSDDSLIKNSANQLNDEYFIQNEKEKSESSSGGYDVNFATNGNKELLILTDIDSKDSEGNDVLFKGTNQSFVDAGKF